MRNLQMTRRNEIKRKQRKQMTVPKAKMRESSDEYESPSLHTERKQKQRKYKKIQESTDEESSMTR